MDDAMLPAMLTIQDWTVFVLGRGDAAQRRLAQVEAAGATDITVFAPEAGADLAAAAGDRRVDRWPQEDEWPVARLAFIADDDHELVQWMAEAARRHRVLLNVEDVPELCDFYMPAMVRRGDLLLAVSTGGKAPGLARAVRGDLEARFGPEWAERTESLARQRAEWRAGGDDPATLAAKTRAFIAEKGWLS